MKLTPQALVLATSLTDHWLSSTNVKDRGSSSMMWKMLINEMTAPHVAFSIKPHFGQQRKWMARESARSKTRRVFMVCLFTSLTSVHALFYHARLTPVRLILQYRNTLQSGTTARSEQVINLNPKFIIEGPAEPNTSEGAKKLSVEEASHRMRISQAKLPSLAKKQPKKD